eukprot:2234652-Prymnesium_polylepis.2
MPRRSTHLSTPRTTRPRRATLTAHHAVPRHAPASASPRMDLCGCLTRSCGPHGVGSAHILRAAGARAHTGERAVCASAARAVQGQRGVDRLARERGPPV